MEACCAAYLILVAIHLKYRYSPLPVDFISRRTFYAALVLVSFRHGSRFDGDKAKLADKEFGLRINVWWVGRGEPGVYQVVAKLYFAVILLLLVLLLARPQRLRQCQLLTGKLVSQRVDGIWLCFEASWWQWPLGHHFLFDPSHRFFATCLFYCESTPAFECLKDASFASRLGWFPTRTL